MVWVSARSARWAWCNACDPLEILAACVHPEAFVDLAQRHAGVFLRLDLTGKAPLLA